MVDALSAEDSAVVFATVEKLAEAGHDPRRFATDLLDRLRDLVLMRSVPDAGERGLVSAPAEELARMNAQAERIGLATLSRYADIVHSGLLEMRGATSPRLVLELLCARMLLPSVTDAEKALLARIERLERRAVVATGGGEAGVEPPVREFQRPSQRTAAPEAAAEVPARAAASAPPRPDAEASPASRPAQAAPPAGPAGSAPTRPVESAGPVASRPVDGAGSAPTRPAEAASPAPQRAAAPASARPAEGARPAPERSAEAGRPAPEESRPEPAPAAENPPARPAPSAESEPVAASDAVDEAGIRAVWPQLLTALRKFTGGRSLEAMLTQATVVEVNGSTVTLTHKSEPLARRLNDQDNARKIAGALADVLPGDWQIRCVHGAVPAAQPRAAAPKQQAPAPERSFTRPSAGAPTPAPAAPAPAPAAPSRPKVTTSEPDIPLPPEPSDEDDDIYSEDSSPVPPPPPEQDPELLARKLISDQLGARPLD
ncbi:DNA polymerase III gamma/tau subunit [Amycolatopsis jiangsuensis]|uniref:DNA polymerase III gamma/tau subunit n=2 Tax=Amycolatopsis jiangsuensis TaxID=1181879 RepID=A0A840J0P7_9PSEU|nr:DNA polymerase III gamma/tau subunit [Amycolatopsis jiangsuensis]